MSSPIQQNSFRFHNILFHNKQWPNPQLTQGHSEITHLLPLKTGNHETLRLEVRFAVCKETVSVKQLQSVTATN